MRIIHLSECFSLATFSHFSIAQKTIAVNKEEVAYTSPSPAENQKVSENIKANAPIRPEETTVMVCPRFRELSVLTIFFAR